MSLLIRAAVLGGLAYFITRSMRGPHAATHVHRQRAGGGAAAGGTASPAGGTASPVGELHPGEDNVWPTSDSKTAAAANAGPSS